MTKEYWLQFYLQLLKENKVEALLRIENFLGYLSLDDKS